MSCLLLVVAASGALQDAGFRSVSRCPPDVFAAGISLRCASDISDQALERRMFRHIALTMVGIGLDLLLLLPLSLMLVDAMPWSLLMGMWRLVLGTCARYVTRSKAQGWCKLLEAALGALSPNHVAGLCLKLGTLGQCLFDPSDQAWGRLRITSTRLCH